MIKDPGVIEKKSFEIIDKELTIEVEEEYKPTIYRMIHTSADFEYATITEIHAHAIKSGIEAIKKGCHIYCDTNMIKAGVKKNLLARYSSTIYTLIDDEAVADEAARRHVTRSIVAMERACYDRETKIFVIGNAPTALTSLKEHIEKGITDPALIIGVPVGFVGAAEAKDAITAIDSPYIITRGRKGGSTIAVAILHSLLMQMD